MFLIVLVDVLGFTIVIPLLAYYAEHFGATPLIATTLVSVYAVCSLLSTPIIGKLSDQYGRKPLLMYSQAGTCAGFLVLALSTNLGMVFIGRILPGLSAGNLSIAQAYISDHTAPENRAKAFGVIGVAFGFGFLFGPALGAFLGDYVIEGPIRCEVSFLVAAGLSALSIFCTYTLLPKEEPPAHTHETAGPGGRRPSAFDWRTYSEYFGRPALRALYVQFFLFSFAFSMFFSGFALFAEHNEHLRWDHSEVGWLFTYSGFLGILMQGGLLGRLVTRFGELKLTLLSFIAACASYTVVAFSTSWQHLVIASTIGAFGHGILRPVLTSRITRAVGRHEQGVAIGISGSLGSIAMAMGPPTGGFLLDHKNVVAWALVPAAVSIVGLVVTMIWSGVSAPELQSKPSEGGSQ
jgi:MFS transporter, DHA1 family, tetracycline resistance protein